MKKILVSMVVLASIIMSTSAFAGGRYGHGGGRELSESQFWTGLGIVTAANVLFAPPVYAVSRPVMVRYIPPPRIYYLPPPRYIVVRGDHRRPCRW